MPAQNTLARPAKRQRLHVANFLDLEAAVDHGYDTDDAPMEEDVDFLDDDELQDQQEGGHHAEFLRQLLVEEDREAAARNLTLTQDAHADDGSLPSMLDLLDEIHAVVQSRKESSAAGIAFADGLGAGLGNEEAEEVKDLRARLPKAHERLFEIPCREGYEEAAVVSIMYLASSPRCPRGGQNPSLAAAFTNPNLPGRIFLEVREYAHAQDVARRVAHLSPVGIVEMDHVDRTRPLQIAPIQHIPHNTWVRVVRPASFRGTIGLLIDSREAPPAVLILRKAMSTALSEAPVFQYVPLSKSVVSTESALPTFEVLRVYLDMGKISNDLYQSTLVRIQHQTLRAGDRVRLLHGDVAGLVGVISSADETTCKVHVPSLAAEIEIFAHELRRNFAIGDCVLATYSRTVPSNVPMWIVSLGSEIAMLINLANKTEYLIKVEELTLCDINDDIPLSIRIPPRLSIVLPRKVYTVSFAQRDVSNDTRLTYIFGRITDIARFNDTTGTLQLAPDWELSPRLQHMPLQLGMECELSDMIGLGGTALLSGWNDSTMSFSNLSAGFKLSQGTMNPKGPYDMHIGKWVFVAARSEYKGFRALVKSVTVDGRATIELQVMPVRQVMVPICDLVLLKSDLMHGLLLGDRLIAQPGLPSVPSTSLWAAPTPPPPVREATPPWPQTEQFVDPFPIPAEQDCSWLEDSAYEGIPVKLQPIKGMSTASSAWRFLRFERVTAEDGTDQLNILFKDRTKERRLPISKLRWVPCTSSGQTVVARSGENRSQQYWTLHMVGKEEILCRVEPKVSNEPPVALPISTLAQVFKSKRT